MSSTMDASDEMLRFVMQVLRYGWKSVEAIATAPRDAIRGTNRAVNDIKEWRGNVKLIKELFGRAKNTQKELANAKSAQEIKDIIDKSYPGMLINIPGENDKVVFPIKAEYMADFSKYMKEHGESAYIMSDLKVEDGEEPLKMVTVDKGELNKVQDFLRSKTETLKGEDTYVWPKEFIQFLKDKYNDLSKEVEMESAREEAIRANKLDEIELVAKNPLESESKPISTVEVGNLADVGQNIVERTIDSKEPLHKDFSPRSVENVQLNNGNLSERSEKGLWTNKNEQPKRKSENVRKSVKNVKRTDMRIKSTGMVGRKVRNLPIHGKDGMEFAEGLKVAFKDDYVVNISEIDQSKINLFKASTDKGFNIHSINDKTFVSFSKKQIDEFILSLSPDVTKKVDRISVLDKIAVGDKKAFAREYNMFELKSVSKPTEKASYTFAEAKERVKTAKVKFEEQRAKEISKNFKEAFESLVGAMNMSGAIKGGGRE